MISMRQLYDYFRSSAAYRVRIALNLKEIDYESIPVNLVDGEQRSEKYLSEQNPQGLVPSFITENGTVITQSLAILDYLEQTYPTPALLPKDPNERAQVLSVAHTIASDIHPIDNLRIMHYLVDEFDVSETQKMDWYHHWIHLGFTALEAKLSKDRFGKFCFGDTPTLADVCLVPQVYNANRFNLDMSAYPTLVAINAYCNELDAFIKAKPESVNPA